MPASNTLGSSDRASVKRPLPHQNEMTDKENSENEPEKYFAPGAGSLHDYVARFSLKAGGEAVQWLLKYLEQRDIRPLPGSPLERAAIIALDLAKEAPGRRVADSDTRDRYADFIGICELAAALRHVRKQGAVDQLLDHLRLLGRSTEKEPAPEPGQVPRPAESVAPKFDPVANYVFELLIAAYAMRVGTDVKVDPRTPAESEQGRNPDVLVTLRGRRWGFACKVLISANKEAVIEHLRTGIRQIEDSEAETGCVLFSLRAKVNLNALWPVADSADPSVEAKAVDGAWVGLGDAIDELLVAADSVRQSVRDVAEEVCALFEGKKSAPGWASYMHGMTAIPNLEAHGDSRVISLRTFLFTPSRLVKKSEIVGVTLLDHAAQLVFDPDDRNL